MLKFLVLIFLAVAEKLTRKTHTHTHTHTHGPTAVCLQGSAYQGINTITVCVAITMVDAFIHIMDKYGGTSLICTSGIRTPPYSGQLLWSQMLHLHVN